jgi:oligopeptide transport system ATP-binding protein
MTARPGATPDPAPPPLPPTAPATTAPGADARPLLEVDDLTMYFPVRKGILQRRVGWVHAVDGISFDLREGETLGLVGESGCGKSTTGRAILQLYRPTSGQVRFEGTELTRLKGGDLRRRRRDMQIIFQDPYASLDPRLTVQTIVAEPLEVHGIGNGRERRERVLQLLEVVGLDPSMAARYPHEFSGGQRQRIGIARAVALDPP